MEGDTGTDEIDPVTVGDSARTAMHADLFNEVISAINRLFKIQVSPQDAGKFVYSDSNIVLQITAAGGCGDPPTTGTYVCGSIEGVQQWLNTEECDCGVDGGSA